MKFIGNYNTWVTPKLMDHLKSHDGDTMSVWQPDKWKGHPMLDEARELCRPAYAHTTHNFQQFNEKSTDMKDFNFDLPVIDGDNRSSLWWFIKLLPGQMQPMHFDPYLVYAKNPKRYSMFLEDWKPGHIFVYEDKILTNYKAGDMFYWDDPMVYHGVVNIGYETRYTLQITTTDD